VCLKKEENWRNTIHKVNNEMEYSMGIPVGTYSAINHMPYLRSTSSNIKMYAALLLTYNKGNQTNACQTSFSILIIIFQNETPCSFIHRYQCSGETCIFKIANMSHLIILALTNMKQSNFKYLDVTYNHIIS
jgi:hypothetical protein